MKKILFCLVFFSLLSNTVCYSQSENWTVLSLKRELYSINFLTQSKAWVFGGDYGYKSSDGGLTWSYPVKLDAKIGFSGGAYFSYPDHIYFIDSLKGWSCQQNEILLKTTNGGDNWMTVNLGYNYTQIYCVQFTDSQTGWCAGERLSQGIIIKTTDSGNSWQIINQNLRWKPNSFQMLNNSKGFLSTLHKDTIAFTNDGWNTLEYKKIGLGQMSSRVLFIDTTNGWVLGNPEYIVRTTSGGTNWIVHTNNIYDNTANFYFLNSLTGWLSTMRSKIYKSTNGGINWFNQLNLYGNSDFVVRDFYFKDSSTGWAVTNDSRILNTTNGGQQWANILNQPVGQLKSVDFTDVHTGWLISYDFYQSVIWKTSNNGYNWSKLYSVQNTILNDIQFSNEQVGFICGENGAIMKTNNGGNNWENISIGNKNIASLSFPVVSIGYACGEKGVIYKTTNSGLNWFTLLNDTTKDYYDVYFPDENNGYIGSDSGFILKTTNGGINWNYLFPNSLKRYNSVFFLNVNTGYAVGKSSNSSGYINTCIVKTTNGGINWNVTHQETVFLSAGYNDIFFLNEQIGWVTVYKGYSGYIYKTTDTGNSWFQTFGPFGGSAGTPNGVLNKVYSKGENNTFVCGENNITLTTSTLVGLQTTSVIIPVKFSLSQNYPNPFNPQTKIKFELPSLTRSKSSIPVRLVIYDLLGREVTTLVNEELKPGTYEAEWDGSNFSSGVYFYKIITNDFTETRKMVLMK